MCAWVGHILPRLQYKHLKTQFTEFCDFKNEIGRCDDVYIYGSLKVKFSTACITTQNTFLPGSNALLRNLKRLSFPFVV